MTPETFLRETQQTWRAEIARATRKAPQRGGKPFPRLEFGRRPAPPLAPGEQVFRRSRIAELAGLTRAVFAKLERLPDAPAIRPDGTYDIDLWRAFVRKRRANVRR
jgi:hypothetical protein